MKKLLFSAAMLLAGVSANAQLAPGSVAPNFTVSAYQPWLATAGSSSNGSYTLYQYLDQGYTVFLDVSATWCGPCWNYHLNGALEDIYAAHGPAGAPGVSASTTDDVMVIWIEGDGSTSDATMLDGSGSIGNWIEPTAGNQIQFPMANPASALANQINNDYNISYFPTIYRICPNRIVEEVGQLGASALYATVSACPPPASAPSDVAALGYTGSLVHCEGSYTPSVQIQNNGTSALTAATVTITQGGTTVSTGSYSGNLATYGVANVTCSPIANFNGGTLSVTVTTAGDASTANNSVNATVASAVNAVSQYITVYITTDYYASETAWTIKNSAGATVAQGGGNWADLTTGQPGTTVQAPQLVTLNPSQCYTFEITDTYGDGICCAYGNGSYTLKDANGTTIAQGGEFASVDTRAFKTGTLGMDELATIAMNVYPNPASSTVNVSFEATNNNYAVALMDLQGRVIAAKNLENLNGTQVVSFSTENVAKGSYIVSITVDGLTTTKNVVIK
ncbi:MAG: T9SS type A sorting domain-containing protein [Sphingomonadales bacterium]|nr:T9SS type A sorting domain-containing protein [Sphingomonadales bacterium]